MPEKRERHRPREVSRDQEVYIIIVHDIPRNCRWQELKDMTRSLGGEKTLKAEVFPVGNGMQMGHCTIKGKSDAVRVYDNLCTRGWNGYRVRVQLSALEKSGELKTVEGPMESHGSIEPARTAILPHQASQGVAIATRSALHPRYATSTQLPAGMTYDPQCTPMSGWPAQSGVTSTAAISAPVTSYSSGMHSYPPPTLHAQTMAPFTHYGVQYLGKSGPTAPSPTCSLPLRPINDGTTIFLSGLPYYQSENELRSLLKRYGNVIYLEVHPDSRNPGKNKGTARARYKSASEALNAVRDLDGKYLRDRKISVKQERDEPLVATTSRRPLRETTNGSSISSRERKSVAFSNISTSKPRGPQRASRGPSRMSDRSSGAESPTGPLVVNGASKPPARRGSRGAVSESDSDDSSDDDDSDKDSHTASDRDYNEGVRVTDMMSRHRL